MSYSWAPDNYHGPSMERAFYKILWNLLKQILEDIVASYITINTKLVYKGSFSMSGQKIYRHTAAGDVKRKLLSFARSEISSG